MFNYDKLEECIAASGKTKTYLCKKMGRPSYYLRDVIRQKNRIPDSLQIILAEELGISVEYLNDIDEEKSPPPVGEGDSQKQAVLFNLIASMTPEQIDLLIHYSNFLLSEEKS